VVVENVTASGNVGHGIHANGVASLVKGSVARGNNGSGYLLNAAFSKYQGNVSAGNGQADLCGGGLCTEHRRYYLTKTTHDGANATSACPSGFHMASLYEIYDTASLRYDVKLGAFSADYGRGPPTDSPAEGWIRTGYTANTISYPGQVNCSGWANNGASSKGTVLRLISDWALVDPSSPLNNAIFPWLSNEEFCNNMKRVWCVEGL
jgi:hypothetical protein